MQERVLGPLGMTRTSYAPQAPYARGLSVHHLAGTLTEEPMHDTGAMAPAGQLWSTLEDLASFAAFLSLGNPEVLADETLAEMRQPEPPALEYGLGLRLLPYADGRLVGHTGSMPGFQATLFADPLNQVGVVALTNATTGFSGAELALALLSSTPPARGAVGAHVDGARLGGGAARQLVLGQLRLRGALPQRASRVARPRTRAVAEQFGLRDGRIVGLAGYHHGETLRILRRDDGTVDHLECATSSTHGSRTPTVPEPVGSVRLARRGGAG